MLEFQRSNGIACRMADYPALTAKHIHGGMLCANRIDMIRYLARKLPDHPAVCEVGVGLGDFSEVLMRFLRPKRFVAIDWFRAHEDELNFGRPSKEVFGSMTHGEFYRRRFATKPVEIREGNSAETLATLDDTSFDLIYIDANHEYDAVRRDAEEALRKIRPTGILIFNDYILFDHLRGTEYGVVPVVNRLVNETDWRINAFALEHDMFCDVALVRP